MTLRKLLLLALLALAPCQAHSASSVAFSWPTNWYTLTDGATISPLCPGTPGVSGNYLLTVLGNGHTISLPSCATPSSFCFRITQGTGGPYTGLSFSPGAGALTFPSGGTPYVQTPLGGATDEVCGLIITSSLWDFFAPQYNMQAPPAYSYFALSTLCNSTSSSSTCSPPAFTVTSGDKLFIGTNACPANNSCSGSASATISSITDSAGFATGCALLTGTRDSSSQPMKTEQWMCNVVGTGNATLTITYSAAVFWSNALLADIHGLNSSPDDGVGSICNGTGANFSCALSGSGTTQNNEFIIGTTYSTHNSDGPATPGTGYSLFGTSNAQIYSVVNTAGANTPSLVVSGNTGLPYSMSVVALKHP